MEEETPLLGKNTTMQSEVENSQEATRLLNAASLNHDLSLQGSEVDELTRILQRAQEMLKLQSEEDTKCV